MSYKVYNELPGVGNGAKSLISEIYHNVYNMMEWEPYGCKCAAVAILLAWCQRGRQTGAKTKNGLQIFCRPGTAKTFYIIHYILQIPDRLPDI